MRTVFTALLFLLCAASGAPADADDAVAVQVSSGLRASAAPLASHLDQAGVRGVGSRAILGADLNAGQPRVENSAATGTVPSRQLLSEQLSRVLPQALPSVPQGALAEQAKTADVVRIALMLTLLAIIPAILICSTSFVRIIVVLSMIRHAFGMPETPPNQVLVSLAIFLTIFSMAPTFEALNANALTPFLDGRTTVQQAIDAGSGPMRDFMLRQTRDQDIRTVYDIAKKPLPQHASEVGLLQLVPAFMLNELRVSFRIGFVVLLPFLLIDLVVSSILLALGMLMLPPSTISLPLKVLMFVLIDGWSLVLEGVLGSFR